MYTILLHVRLYSYSTRTRTHLSLTYILIYLSIYIRTYVHTYLHGSLLYNVTVNWVKNSPPKGGEFPPAEGGGNFGGDYIHTYIHTYILYVRIRTYVSCMYDTYTHVHSYSYLLLMLLHNLLTN